MLTSLSLLTVIIITWYFSKWRDQRSLFPIPLLCNNQHQLWLTTPTRIKILPNCICLSILVSILWAAGCQVKNCSFCRTVKRCWCRTTTCIPAWYFVLFPLNMFSLLAYICGVNKRKLKMMNGNVTETRNCNRRLFISIWKYWFHMYHKTIQNKMEWFTLYRRVLVSPVFYHKSCLMFLKTPQVFKIFDKKETFKQQLWPHKKDISETETNDILTV